ncbi:MAG: biopolymer transporter ExbD [Candidatus Zixiibacteriota bacterium]
MLKRMKRRVAIRIDMTPMVDIAFLLLIFYMATTTFKPPEHKSVNIPTSHSEIKLPESNLMTITITKEDSVFVDYIISRKKTVVDEETGKETEITVPDRIYEEADLQNISQVITRMRISDAAARTIPLIIKADEEVTYGTMATLMDALQGININKFSLVTEMETEQLEEETESEEI